ncbi:hypothetical protein Si021_00980 [Streptococcus infantarius subsp. infantarius]|nr:hypothetical protein [Streptococcus infantarius subsp. infantarius]MCO4653105.1 hypothetical protein [Streptococcus infantarius subsp. infantarius]MCO4655239.1 hypothetical protein [Streptococcus infantarius subsp. infantarius]MCO4661225.1 hypothetical protein [Streptococcus infantarius subsp. infantarius]MCO4665394.1 hypothetical protein [Streptococcus infantarius subsp. infantarius]
MNKQELIKKINDLDEITINVQTDDGPVGISYFRKPEVLELVKQIEKPEKPVVPRCVADMIVKRKRAGQNVVKAIENLRFYEDACKWVRNNGEAFVKAWLYGYEVEKEQLYTVEIPNPNGFIRLVLCRECDGKLFVATFSGGIFWQKFGKCKLTESEIKEDFDWAWQFAEEVKE